MKKIILLAIASLGVMSLSAQSQEELLTKIKEKNTLYTTISSTFTQMQHFSFLGDDTKGNGHFYYEKPTQAIMKFTTPSGDALLMNGDRFTMVAGGKTAKTTAKASPKIRVMQNVMKAGFDGNLSALDAKSITRTSAKDMYQFEAVMNGDASKTGVATVVIGFDKSDMSLVQLKMIDEDGSYTEYRFGTKTFNQTLDKSTFTLK